MKSDNLDRCMKSVVAAAGLGILFGLNSSAHAQDWKAVGQFGWLGVGKTYQLEKGHSVWVGEYSGTFFSDKGQGSLFDHAGVKCPSILSNDTNNKKVKAAGYCTISDPSGDQSWQGEGDGMPGHPTHGTFEYIGGTGKYQQISGQNIFAGVQQINWQDGTASGYSTWNR